jgi:hypothetical protein
MAADIDLMFGSHSGPTHGVGAAVIAGVVTVLVVSAVRWPITTRTTVGVGRLGLAVMAAYATHTLLDWLGTDSSPPIGIMALWPLSREYHESAVHLFMAISRRYWLAEFWRHNVYALARELVILVPTAAIVWRLRVRLPSGRSPTPEA